MDLPDRSLKIAFSFFVKVFPMAFILGTQAVYAQSSLSMDALPSQNLELSSPTFKIKPNQLRVRHRLSGLDTHWTEPSDEMNFVIRFILSGGKKVKRIAFPVTQQSPGWTGDLENTPYSTQKHQIPIPANTKQVQLIITSSGSPQAVGIYAIKGLNISVIKNEKISPFFADGLQVDPPIRIWNRSGTRPSMAHEGPAFPTELRLIDTDITAHADWSFVKLIKGDALIIKWEEAYSIGKGGPRPITYDRLPPGDYSLEAEELDINGQPTGNIKTIQHIVPRPFWKSWWFWLLCLVAIASTVLLFFRWAVRHRIRRAVRHARLLEKERLRIAMDLHDDIGPRLSQISLIGSHARMREEDSKSKESFLQITQLTGELANSLSETVWMLSPKNNDLESLIGFLCRIASELCRVGGMRCRIDADNVEDDIHISQEFRHHFVLLVKEALNNTLKHSKAEEVRLQVKLHDKQLRIVVSDDGVGSQKKKITPGNGLESMKRRMAELNGTFTMEEAETGGFQIYLSAPLKQKEY